jgi:hypothetical protein
MHRCVALTEQRYRPVATLIPCAVLVVGYSTRSWAALFTVESVFGTLDEEGELFTVEKVSGKLEDEGDKAKWVETVIVKNNYAEAAVDYFVTSQPYSGRKWQ